MRYDVRTITLRGSQLTFSTCDKRIKTIITIPEFFTERYPETDGWKLKGANIGMAVQLVILRSRGKAQLQVPEERHKGGARGCALYEPEVLGVQDDRQGFKEGEQIRMQALWKHHACRRKCRHQHP